MVELIRRRGVLPLLKLSLGDRASVINLLTREGLLVYIRGNLLVMPWLRASSDKVLSRLGTRIRFRLVHYARLEGSSQDMVLKCCEENVEEGLVVVADEIRGARGRMGRKWLAPRGGLWFSILLTPDKRRFQLLSLTASLAVADALRLLGLNAGVKWPNDVAIGGRKVCGVLVESVVKGGEICAAVGIGLNLNNPIPRELSNSAVSVSEVLGVNVPEGQLLRVILKKFDELYWNPHMAIETWKRFSVTLGRRVRVYVPEGILEGVAETIDSEGSLVIRCDEKRVRVHIGEVIHLREVE